MINLEDAGLVQQIIGEVEKSEDMRRRKHSFDNWQIYSGNVNPYVEEEIRQNRPSSYSSYTCSDISLSKMVVDTLAKSYKEQPLRSVENDDIKSERVQEIWKQADALRQMPFNDTIFNLQRYSLFWVSQDDNLNYRFTTLQGDQFAVILDKSSGKLLCVVLIYGNTDIVSGAGIGDGVDDLIAETKADQNATYKAYALWTDTQHVRVGMQFKNNSITKMVYGIDEDNPENINELGMLPFVYMSKELGGNYPTLSPLKDQTITFNYQRSELMTASNIQGTGQLIFKYPMKLENLFKRMTTGLMTAIRLPQSSNPEDRDTTAEYISPSPNLDGMKSVIDTYVKDVLRENGIDAGSYLNGTTGFNSGLERAIANASVDDVVEANQKIYMEFERQIFDIVKSYESLNGVSVFSEEDQLSIVFRKPKVLISDKETLDNINLKLSMGLISKVDALMMLDPNMTEMEAQEKLDAIDESRNQSVRGIIGEVSETDEDAEA